MERVLESHRVRDALSRVPRGSLHRVSQIEVSGNLEVFFFFGRVDSRRAHERAVGQAMVCVVASGAAQRPSIKNSRRCVSMGETVSGFGLFDGVLERRRTRASSCELSKVLHRTGHDRDTSLKRKLILRQALRSWGCPPSRDRSSTRSTPRTARSSRSDSCTTWPSRSATDPTSTLRIWRFFATLSLSLSRASKVSRVFP